MAEFSSNDGLFKFISKESKDYYTLKYEEDVIGRRLADVLYGRLASSAKFLYLEMYCGNCYNEEEITDNLTQGSNSFFSSSAKLNFRLCPEINAIECILEHKRVTPIKKISIDEFLSYDIHKLSKNDDFKKSRKKDDHQVYFPLTVELNTNTKTISV